MKNVFTNLQAGDMYVHKYLKQQVKKTAWQNASKLSVNSNKIINAKIITDKEFKENKNYIKIHLWLE